MSNTELIAEARKWRKSALPPTPWGDDHIVNRLADALEAAGQQVAVMRSEQIEEDATIAEGIVPIVDDSVMEAHAKNIGMVIATAIRAQLEVQP